MFFAAISASNASSTLLRARNHAHSTRVVPETSWYHTVSADPQYLKIENLLFFYKKKALLFTSWTRALKHPCRMDPICEKKMINLVTSKHPRGCVRKVDREYLSGGMHAQWSCVSIPPDTFVPSALGVTVASPFA